MSSLAKQMLITKIQHTVKYPNIFQLTCLLCRVTQTIQPIAKATTWFEIHFTPYLPNQLHIGKWLFNSVMKIPPKGV